MAALHEDAILKLAIKRGLLSDADLHDLTLLAIDQTLETGRWAPGSSTSLPQAG